MVGQGPPYFGPTERVSMTVIPTEGAERPSGGIWKMLLKGVGGSFTARPREARIERLWWRAMKDPTTPF